MMTPEQNFKFRMLVSNLLNSRVTGESDARQLAHEDHLRNYVDGILDEKDAERAANADELDKQIEISTRELVETTLSFCNIVSGAINCYEDGTIKDLMKELSTNARDTATRVMAYTDVRDSHRK